MMRFPAPDWMVLPLIESVYYTAGRRGHAVTLSKSLSVKMAMFMIPGSGFGTRDSGLGIRGFGIRDSAFYAGQAPLRNSVSAISTLSRKARLTAGQFFSARTSVFHE